MIQRNRAIGMLSRTTLPPRELLTARKLRFGATRIPLVALAATKYPARPLLARIVFSMGVRWTAFAIALAKEWPCCCSLRRYCARPDAA